MNPPTILIVFGGESAEHDISVMSASNVYNAIDTSKYDVKLCYIDTTGIWWLVDSWPEDVNAHGGVKIVPVFGTQSFMTLPDAKELKIDLLFPVLHGENGHEDGTIQGLAHLTHIKMIGSGLGASAVCWDKLYTKQLLAANNILVTPFQTFRAGQDLPLYDALAAELGSELFVKPTVAGSSVGVSKVHDASELEPALDEAIKHGRTALIEKAISGREIEVAVMGNPPNHSASDIGEIIPGEEFYSYEDKYSLDSKAQVLTSVDMAEDMRQSIRDIALQAYAVLGCRGLARIDFLVSNDGEIYVNELNTLPGFTNISQYPKLWNEQGISYSDLIDQLINLGLE